MSTNDPFGGDKRTDETVMIGSDAMDDLVAQAKAGSAASGAPDVEGEADAAASAAFQQEIAAPAAAGSKNLLIIGAVVLALAVIAILVLALG